MIASTPRLLTPSKVTAWLECAHVLTLQHQVDVGVIAKPGGGVAELAQLLFDKGNEHERNCLAHLRRDGEVFEVPDRERGETFTAHAARVGHLLQLCFYADAIEAELGGPARSTRCA